MYWENENDAHHRIFECNQSKPERKKLKKIISHGNMEIILKDQKDGQ